VVGEWMKESEYEGLVEESKQAKLNIYLAGTKIWVRFCRNRQLIAFQLLSSADLVHFQHQEEVECYTV